MASFQIRRDIDNEMEKGQDEDEMAFLNAKDTAEEALQMRSAIVLLEPVLAANERPDYLDLEVRMICLQDTTMEYFETRLHKSPKSELEIDSWSSLF
jgi:hypothetical protein